MIKNTLLLPNPSCKNPGGFNQIKNSLKSHLRKKFSEDEDQKLRELVQQYGTNQWTLIAEQMAQRTGRQCRDRYRNYLQPGFFNGQWTQQEDELLYYRFQEFGPQWTLLTNYFRGRSANSIKNRWNYFVSRMNYDEKEITPNKNIKPNKCNSSDGPLNNFEMNMPNENELFEFNTDELDFSIFMDF